MTQISSYGTFYVKTIFPVGVFISTPFIVYMSLKSINSFEENLMIWIFNTALILIAFYVIKLKDVFWDSDYIIVKSWNKEVKIEKWEISKIDDNYIGRPNFVQYF